MKIEIDNLQKWQYSLAIKMVLLAVMGLMLLIPLEMIKEVIRERQKSSETVKKEISAQWASAQTVSGPVLNIPVNIHQSQKETESNISVFHIMPETMNISGSVRTEKRYRSIYKTIVYTANLLINGNFTIPEIPGMDNNEVLWDEAYYTFGISDNRGIKGGVELEADTVVYKAIPGLKDNDIFPSGITFPAGISKPADNFSYSINLDLSGSESLSFAPVGENTKVSIQSSWNSPGFTGNFLPASREITNDGFSAEWYVTNLNRNFPQYWTGKSFNPDADSFGVEFVLLVDHYQKSLRSAKYGILFIALTFLSLIFVELSNMEKINIFQYFLVALGLVLFFSLLNSLSEHTGFNIAYLISSVATILLISFFLGMIIKNNRSILSIVVLLAILYSFIFILLTLNDWAYLAGNIGLFILLAITMRLSAKVNFKVRQSSDTEQQ